MNDVRAPGRAEAPWRLLGLERGPAEALLARGLSLLDALPAGGAALRWYVPDSPALVLGRGQLPETLRAEVPVLRRHSGGGAVYLDADVLSLDVLLPTGHPLLEGDLGAVFLRVGRAWADALGELGITGLTVHQGASAARRLGDERQRLLAAVCYALPGRGEVLHDGRKLVGLAQRRRRHGALIQCGLLRRWRPGPLLAALGADPDDAQVGAAAIGLDELLSAPLGDAVIMAAVERRLARAVTG